MANQEIIEVEQITIEGIRLKSNERGCPRCEAVLILNENEQCFECSNCGYIDCGDDD